MIGRMCAISMKKPQNLGAETITGHTYSNGGGKEGHGFLYLPEKHVAVHYITKNCIASNERLTEEQFQEKIKALKIDIDKGLKVQVAKDLADVIENGDGTFARKEWFLQTYKDISTLTAAMMHVNELYFKVCCEK